MTTTQNTSKKSSELATGDVVLCSGMMVQIDRPIETNSGTNGRKVYWTRGLVLNIDEIDATDPWLGSFVRSDRRDGDGEGVRWQIQGNDLVTWGVVA